MPIGVVILVKHKQKLCDERLETLRKKFLKEMKLTIEDFYNSKALTYVNSSDYKTVIVDKDIFYILDVNLWEPYFGLGYERGNIELFIQCAEWFEKEIPDCEIYYGNDVDNNNIRLFGINYRQKLLNLFNQKSN